MVARRPVGVPRAGDTATVWMPGEAQELLMPAPKGHHATRTTRIGGTMDVPAQEPGSAPRATAVAPPPRGWTGHRRAALGASPFSSTLPGVVAASGFGVACLVWLAAGDRLPGGRWLAVHLFTLGVLTILIWTFSQHFAASFTATRALAPQVMTTRVLSGLLVGSIVTMLFGRDFDAHWPLVLGSLGIMLIVGWNLLVLRKLRRHAQAPRFAWIVRQYEHAHIAFLVAASLGGALGAGWIPGPGDVPVEPVMRLGRGDAQRCGCVLVEGKHVGSVRSWFMGRLAAGQVPGATVISTTASVAASRLCAPRGHVAQPPSASSTRTSSSLSTTVPVMPSNVVGPGATWSWSRSPALRAINVCLSDAPAPGVSVRAERREARPRPPRAAREP